MDVHIQLSGRGDLSTRIYRQLLDAVLDGRLRAGERLPPTRVLARRLSVSRNTVAVAYERLAAEGVLVGRVGAGSFITTESIRQVRARRAPAGSLQARPQWRSLKVPASSAAADVQYDFSVGVPDPGLFPFEHWRRAVGAELGSSRSALAGYGDPAGLDRLREAIARHIGLSRAVRANAADVIVTNGAQQAIDLVAKVLVPPGTCVAVEDPGYLYARLAFRSLGARVVGVPVDAEGIDVARIPAAARVVYVTPSHQFPLGTAMSFERRLSLLAWAERRGAAVVEDDYDSEFRFDGRPLDPLQSLDRSGRVIYIGSFSKMLSPAIRLGFLVAPGSLHEALVAARQLADWHGDPVAQGALARFIDDGYLAAHIRKIAREYAARHAQVVESVARWLDGQMELIPAAAGLHMAGRLITARAGHAAAWTKRALERGVRVSPLSEFVQDVRPIEGVVLGYGLVPSPRIDEGIRRLAAALHERNRPAVSKTPSPDRLTSRRREKTYRSGGSS